MPQNEKNSENDYGKFAGFATAQAAGYYATSTLGYAADFVPGYGN